jgi:hypothetical protein
LKSRRVNYCSTLKVLSVLIDSATAFSFVKILLPFQKLMTDAKKSKKVSTMGPHTK